MSDFITKDDYKHSIRTYRLDQLLDDDDDVLTPAEDEAEAIIIDALYKSYNTEHILTQTGDDRAKNVLKWMKCLVLYAIYQRVPDELVPERVVKDYDDTMRTLNNIAAGKMSVNLPRRVDVESKQVTKFRYGSVSARSH